MWRLLAPLVEHVLATMLSSAEARAWLGTVRAEFVEQLRVSIDELCQKEGW